jgi:hypothetical protein
MDTENYVYNREAAKMQNDVIYDECDDTFAYIAGYTEVSCIL